MFMESNLKLRWIATHPFVSFSVAFDSPTVEMI